MREGIRFEGNDLRENRYLSSLFEKIHFQDQETETRRLEIHCRKTRTGSQREEKR